MVTNVKEGRTKKCEQYWPEDASVSSFGPFNVSVVEQRTFADYVIRHIQLIVSLSMLVYIANRILTETYLLLYKHSTLVMEVVLVN